MVARFCAGQISGNEDIILKWHDADTQMGQDIQSSFHNVAHLEGSRRQKQL